MLCFLRAVSDGALCAGRGDATGILLLTGLSYAGSLSELSQRPLRIFIEPRIMG
jgi:hypothetical protein